MTVCVAPTVFDAVAGVTSMLVATATCHVFCAVSVGSPASQVSFTSRSTQAVIVLVATASFEKVKVALPVRSVVSLPSAGVGVPSLETLNSTTSPDAATPSVMTVAVTV